MTNYLHISQAARKYGILPKDWHHAVCLGKAPGPTHNGDTPTRRVYTEGEAAEAAAMILAARRQRPEGAISVKEAAAMMGLAGNTVGNYATLHKIGVKHANKTWLFDRDIKKLYRLIPSLANRGTS